jgi:hypothetical protein
MTVNVWRLVRLASATNAKGLLLSPAAKLLISIAAGVLATDRGLGIGS